MAKRSRSPAEFVVATIPGYDEFEMDIVRVLKEQLPTFFDRMEAAPLTRESVMAIGSVSV
jgi:hypothetical protein